MVQVTARQNGHAHAGGLDESRPVLNLVRARPLYRRAATPGAGLRYRGARLVLDFGFNVLGLRSIMLRVYEYNHAARRRYEKAGFREFGRRSQSQFINGRAC